MTSINATTLDMLLKIVELMKLQQMHESIKNNTKLILKTYLMLGDLKLFYADSLMFYMQLTCAIAVLMFIGSFIALLMMVKKLSDLNEKVTWFLKIVQGRIEKESNQEKHDNKMKNQEKSSKVNQDEAS